MESPGNDINVCIWTSRLLRGNRPTTAYELAFIQLGGIDTLSRFACQEAQSFNMRHIKINGLREPATEKWAKFHRY